MLEILCSIGGDRERPYVHTFLDWRDFVAWHYSYTRSQTEAVAALLA